MNELKTLKAHSLMIQLNCRGINASNVILNGDKYFNSVPKSLRQCIAVQKNK